MKTFLISTLIGFLLLTAISLFIHSTDYVTVYGFPNHFYKHESAIPSMYEYEAHHFYPVNFLLDLACAMVIGLIGLGISKIIYKKS
ncbi:hypothetical protein [Paradesertivirga mongoliensis]|uniref:hypothetical protein n=1 Tax=Paradesertivirga mongoliensis TaxID=2100740 RepID=UPI00210D57A2|nr:hypothetical protein [Pedobacter mongoliensis]